MINIKSNVWQNNFLCGREIIFKRYAESEKYSPKEAVLKMSETHYQSLEGKILITFFFEALRMELQTKNNLRKFNRIFYIFYMYNNFEKRYEIGHSQNNYKN